MRSNCCRASGQKRKHKIIYKVPEQGHYTDFIHYDLDTLQSTTILAANTAWLKTIGYFWAMKNMPNQPKFFYRDNCLSIRYFVCKKCL